MLAELGGRIEFSFTELVVPEELNEITEQYVREGANVIIDTTAYGDPYVTVCEENPDIYCLEVYGLPFFGNNPEFGKNESAFYPRHWEGAYLHGVAAGLLTETNTIGTIGSFEIPLIFAQINSYALGCQSVNPDCEVIAVFQNSWLDAQKETQISNTMVDAGADFLYSFLDDPATVVVAEERGVWGASAFRDQPEFAPTGYVNAYTFDWSGIFTRELSAILDGTWTPGRIELTTFGDGMHSGTWGSNVPQGVRDTIDSLRDQIISGEVNPFVGPISDQDGVERFAAGEELSDAYLYSGWDFLVQSVK